MHLAVAWLGPAALPRDHRHLALNRRKRAWRPLECEPLNRLAQPRSQAVASAIGTLGPYETAQALSPIATHPTLHGPLWHVELTGKPCQWDVVLKSRPQLLKPSEGCGSLVLREFGQWPRLLQLHSAQCLLSALSSNFYLVGTRVNVC